MAGWIEKGSGHFIKPYLREFAVSGIVAKAGGGQANATVLTAGINIVATVASANDSVVLPATVQGSGGSPLGAIGVDIVVVNTGANSMNLFPASGDSIDGLAANSAIPIPSNTMAILACGSKNNWYADVCGFGGATGFSQTTPSNPTQTSSATYVMMGLAGSITPTLTGRVIYTISGDVTATNGQTATWQLSHGTGTAPVNGAAVTGTQDGPQPTFTALTGLLTVPFSTQFALTGLTRGTAYWLDLALKSSSGNVSVSNLSVSAVEN